jgi:hypothetical protein
VASRNKKKQVQFSTVHIYFIPSGVSFWNEKKQAQLMAVHIYFISSGVWQWKRENAVFHWRLGIKRASAVFNSAYIFISSEI